MPVKPLADIPLRPGASHPVPAVDKCKARRKQRLGDAVGLDQFGVNRVELDPGVWSTVRHWHSHEDEFVMVLEGELTLVTDGGDETLKAGDCAGFKAGVENGHRLENRSDALAVYLEVGSRRPDADETTYPDDDLMVRHDSEGRQVFMRRDGTIICPAD
jgi:uncharacterized cupin superfamily protein